MKPNTATALATSIVCLLPIIPGILLWDQLPEQLIMHWNAAGEPDGYAPKAIGVFGLPLLMCGINLFVQFGLQTDPKIQNASKTLVLLAKWFVPILTLIVMPITLFASMGVDIPIMIIIPLLIGVVFIAIGNYLPKSKQSYTVGIRLPWTLNSEENWNRTHHLAGYLWILGGVLMLLSAFLPAVWFLPVLIIIMILVVGIPFAYSYSLYRKGV
jgi:uncharacterized membrane protein